MNGHQREGGRLKRFLFLKAAALATTMFTVSATAAPDLVIVNGDVYTVDAEYPRAEAFAVEDG